MSEKSIFNFQMLIELFRKTWRSWERIIFIALLVHFCALINFYGSRCAMPYTLFSHFSFHAHSRARSSRKCNYRTHKNVNLARTRKGGEANFSHTKLDSPKRICLGKRGSKVMAEAIYYYFLLCTTPLACRGLMWIENGSPIISPPYKCQKKTVEVACSSSSSPQPISPSPRLECNIFLLLLISKRSQTLTPPTGLTPPNARFQTHLFYFLEDDKLLFSG